MNIIIFLVLGFCTSLLFPPYFIYPIGFIIFPYLCLFIEKNKLNLSKKLLFLYSFIFGISFFSSLLFWITNPFLVFDETSSFFYLSFILVIIITLIFSTIFTIAIAYNRIFPLIFLIPLIFIISEFVISIFIYGFPWVTFSLITSNNFIFLFLIKHFGTLPTSFIVILIFCTPYLIFHKIRNIIKISFLIIFILPLTIIILFQNISKKNLIEDSKELSVEIFQINQKPTLTYLEQEKEFLKILKLINTSDSDILIFAENNLPYKFNDKLNIIQKNLNKNQTVIIGGTNFREGKYFNSLININKFDIQYFDKKILVPFGEFLPLRNILKFFEPISGSIDYSKGNKIRKMKINNEISYIPVICYEIIFYWKLINNYNFDANFIINITNDLWFGESLGPYQHLYLSKTRAAEFNKSIIRVSNNGISAVINENGIIKYSTELFKEINFKKSITIRNNNNFYKFHNFIKNYFIIVFTILFILNLKLLHGNRKT